MMRLLSIIFLASLVVWFLQNFGLDFRMVADTADSILAKFGGFIAAALLVSSALLDVPRGADDEEAALAGIAAMENFYREIKMPVSIRGLGVEPSEAQIKKMSAKCAANHPDGMGKMKKLFEDDIERIFRAAM